MTSGVTDVGVAPGAALFRARGMSSDIEAQPVSAALPLPARLNAAAPRRYYLYLMAPAIAVLAFISLYPFVWLIVMSLQDVGVGEGEWVGLKNYTRLFSDERFLEGWLKSWSYNRLRCCDGCSYNRFRCWGGCSYNRLWCWGGCSYNRLRCWGDRW